jgi:hypothetical protein
MPSIILALAGSLAGTGAVTLLYRKWRGDIRHSYALVAAWAGVAASILLWSAAYEPYVGVPFAILVMTLVAMGFLLSGADLKAVAQFPSTRRAASDAAGRTSWSGVAARTLSSVVAAPVVGMILGLLAWPWVPGHDATRFFTAVIVFLAGSAAIIVWGLSAVRPWRALGMILLIGMAAAVPVALGL